MHRLVPCLALAHSSTPPIISPLLASPLASSSSSSSSPLPLASSRRSRLVASNPRPRLSCLYGMEWFCTADDNKSLVKMLRQMDVIKFKSVADVMEEIDRGLFVPKGNSAYTDTPMPIGYNATISAPHMHALCLELLKDNLQPGMHALDVGSGTGYLTACFGLMIGPQGYAVGVEHIPELVQQSTENVKASKAADLLSLGRLSFHAADGREGWPERAPYDAIHVGAAAPEIPKALIEQLKPGGRMVIPVGDFFQDLRVIDKRDDGTLKQWSETSVRYVPLTSKKEQLQGWLRLPVGLQLQLSKNNPSQPCYF